MVKPKAALRLQRAGHLNFSDTGMWAAECAVKLHMWVLFEQWKGAHAKTQRFCQPARHTANKELGHGLNLAQG